MKIALSEISTLNASFAGDVAAYAAAGFDGMMVDTAHLWDTPGLAAEIALHARRVTGLHVADKLAPGAPGRVLPRQGVTHPELLVGLLRAAGFDGYLDIEILSTPEGFWGLPADGAASRAAAAAQSLIAQS